jgi:hypothetical protein
MRRRELIAGIGAAVAYPLTTQAQRGERVRLVAVLMGAARATPRIGPKSQPSGRDFRYDLDRRHDRG